MGVNNAASAVDGNKQINKALTFSELSKIQQGLKHVEFNVDKGMKKKQNKTHNNKKGGTQNSNSMMNINPFVPSDIHSKISFDNINKSQSSMSREGQEMVSNMKEFLREVNASNLTPDKHSPLKVKN